MYDSGLLVTLLSDRRNWKARTYLIHVRMRSPMTSRAVDRHRRLSAEVLKKTKMRSRSSRGRGLRGYVICGTKSHLYDISATNPRLWCAVGLAHISRSKSLKNPHKKSIPYIFWETNPISNFNYFDKIILNIIKSHVYNFSWTLVHK